MLGILDVLGISLKEVTKNIATPHIDNQLLGKSKVKHAIQDGQHIAGDSNKGDSTKPKKLANRLVSTDDSDRWPFGESCTTNEPWLSIGINA
jgi:hypothetical protein